MESQIPAKQQSMTNKPVDHHEPNEIRALIAQRIKTLPTQHRNGLICGARFHLDRAGLHSLSSRHLVEVALTLVLKGGEREAGAEPPKLADLDTAVAFKFYLKAFLRVTIETLAQHPPWVGYPMLGILQESSRPQFLSQPDVSHKPKLRSWGEEQNGYGDNGAGGDKISDASGT